MLINYSEDALDTLIQIVHFIEGINTEGAGERWLEKFERFFQNKVARPEYVGKCSNETFKKLQLRCIYYKDWVIAFSIYGDDILVEAILHVSKITD